jgi:hypothetical protein
VVPRWLLRLEDRLCGWLYHSGKSRSAVPGWLLRLGLPADGVVARHWSVILGVAAGVVLGLPLFCGVVWLAWPRPAPLAVPRPAESPVVRAQLEPVPPVEIHGGKTATVELVVDRTGPNQDLRVELVDLPRGVRCPVVRVPAGEGQARVKAILEAGPDIDERTTRVTAVLWRGGARLNEQRFDLTAHPFRYPRLKDIPAIRLVRGENITLEVPVEDNGNRDKWQLVVELLPPGVTAKPPSKLVRPGFVGVDLEASPLAALTQEAKITLVLRAGGLLADQKTALLSVSAR